MLNVTGIQVFANATVAGSFNSSVPILNDIHRIVTESAKSNFGSVWMDCPHR